MQQLGWKAKTLPRDIALKIEQQEELVQKKMAAQRQEVNMTVIQDVDGNQSIVALVPIVHGLEKTQPRSFVALKNREGELLFMISLREIPGSLQAGRTLGEISIYDASGNLVAHSLRDIMIDKYEFIDPDSGYLLATGESPALGLNIAIKDLPVDWSKADVRPFGLRFELGGYAQSSKLLEANFRWVIAVALQARALRDAHQAMVPWQPYFLRLVDKCSPLVIIGAATFLATCIMRAVTSPMHKKEPARRNGLGA